MSGATVPPRVQRHRRAEADRRKVRTVNQLRGRRRAAAPRRRTPQARRPAYRGTAYAFGMSGVLSMLAFATGSMLWAVGAVTTAGAGAVVARIEYRRELAQVKATGKPIEDPKAAQKPRRPASDEPVVETAADVADVPAPRRPARRQRARPRADGDHASRCTAKSASTCRCVDGPNRRGTKGKTTTKRTTGARKRTT